MAIAVQNGQPIQKDPETGDWDEHKGFVGFQDEAEGRNVIADAYDDGARDRVGGLTEMGLDEFAAWIREYGQKDEPLTVPPSMKNAYFTSNQREHKHVIPDFRERMAQLRRARHHDFSEVLDRIAHIGTMRTAAEMKVAIDDLVRALPELGDAAMRGGRATRIVAEMLTEAFTRSLADGGNPKRIIRR